MFRLLKKLLDSLYLFTASYSNNVFPEPLGKEEENKYLKEMNLGNSDARNKLIEHNLRLVAHIAKKYSSAFDSDDLISIGTIGLIKGIDSYKLNNKTRLTTYCARCIDNEILMHFRANKKNDKNISIEESVYYDNEGNPITLLDILKEDDPDYATKIYNKENLSKLKDYFKVLNKMEKEIIIKRYGLNNEDEKTQKQIAKDLKISRSYVSRIEKRALTKMLKEFIKNKQL